MPRRRNKAGQQEPAEAQHGGQGHNSRQEEGGKEASRGCYSRPCRGRRGMRIPAQPGTPEKRRQPRIAVAAPAPEPVPPARRPTAWRGQRGEEEHRDPPRYGQGSTRGGRPHSPSTRKKPESHPARPGRRRSRRSSIPPLRPGSPPRPRWTTGDAQCDTAVASSRRAGRRSRRAARDSGISNQAQRDVSSKMARSRPCRTARRRRHGTGRRPGGGRHARYRHHQRPRERKQPASARDR